MRIGLYMDYSDTILHPGFLLQNISGNLIKISVLGETCPALMSPGPSPSRHGRHSCVV